MAGIEKFPKFVLAVSSRKSFENARYENVFDIAKFSIKMS